MKKYLKGKNVLAAILCATLMLGIVPFTVFAANTDENLYTKNQISTSVQYLNQERTQAEITYSVPIEPQEPVNVIFLVDASKTGENSKNEVVELIMGHGDGVDLMYKYGTKNNVNIISYASDVQETGFINSKEELQKYSSIETMSGEADEAVALEKAASAVQQAHEMNGNPTVVVWALGSSFNKEAEVDEQLKALDQVLSENDAFITYQMTDAPSTTLQNYATKFIPAGGTDEISAAYAYTTGSDYEWGMLNDLEAIVHDHYKNADFTLNLADGQTMITSIDEVNAKALILGQRWTGYVAAEITENGKGVQVHMDKLCSGDTLLITAKVTLDPNTAGPETVFEGQDILLKNSMYTGLFDEKTNDITLHFPAVELNKGERMITYRLGDDGTVSGSAPGIQTVASGEPVTIASADGISKTGYTFGGWIVAEGEHAGERYAANEAIAMPDYDLVLEPAWGYVGVEVEVGQAVAPVTQNQIMEIPGQMQALDFSQIFVNDTKIGNTVHTITFLDELLEYVEDPTPTDSNKVIVKGRPEIVYARNIGAPGNSVIAYIVADHQNGYDMYISAEGGVKASSRCLSLFAAFDPVSQKYVLDGWNQNLHTVDFNNQFDTSTATELGMLFYNCTSLKEVKGIENLDVSNVTVLQSLFYGCSSLVSMDLSAWDTSSVTNASYLFANCTGLQDVQLHWDQTDTQNFITIQNMFQKCESLVSMADSGVEDWVLPNVTEARSFFWQCTNLQTVDLSKWNPQNIVNLPFFFFECHNLQSFSMEGWNVPTLKSLQQAFTNCYQLEVIDLSSWGNINSLDDLYAAFSSCSNLKTLKIPNIKSGYKDMFFWCTFDYLDNLQYLDISGWVLDGPNSVSTSEIWGNSWPSGQVTIIADNWEVTADDILADAENLNLIWNIGTKSFSANHWNLNDTRQDLSAASDWLISNITELKGWSGLSGVTSMEGMLAGQSRLERVSITEANMPNLTSTANMFSGCTKLTEVDLSGWTGMESTAITGMFANAPTNIDLTADSDAIGTAIKEEYKKNTSSVRNTMENAGVKSIDKNNVQRNTKPAEPKHTVEEDTSMYGTIEQPLVKEVNKENNEIRWHEVETPAGTELYLKTTIQYVGDIGAKSEDINLEVVLPQGMVPAQEPEVVIGGFQYTGEETGYRSGSVEAEPTISTNEAGKTVMTAKVGSMYTGTEIEISFKVKLEDIAATGQYKLWDVTATTKDKNSTAKDALRFWEAVTTEGTEYPITIESTGTGQAWTDVIRAAPGTPITVYTQGGTVESITATDSNGNKIDISESQKVRIAETNQYTFQMPSAAVTVKVVFAQSQQPQAPGETPETGGMNGAQTGDMEGTGGMDSPRTGDTNSMVAVIAVVSICAACTAGVLLYMLSKGKKQR